MLLAVVLAAGTVGPAARSAPAAAPEAASVRIVKVEGAAMGYNYSLSVLVRMLAPEGGRPFGMLAADGDLLVFSPSDEERAIFLPYQAADGDAIVLDLKPGRVLLGGKTVSVFLGEAGGWEWLEKAPADEKKDLRLVGLPAKVETGRLPLLMDLARLRPKAGLWLDAETKPEEPGPETAAETGDAKGAAAKQPEANAPNMTAAKVKPPKPDLADAARQVLPLFRPAFAFLGEPAVLKAGPEVPLALLETETILFFGGKVGPEEVAILARLPRLRTLLVPNWPFGKGPVPLALRGLRSLRVMNAADLTDLAPLADLKDLEDLHLAADEVKDLGPLGNLKNLRRLSLKLSDGPPDLAALKDLPLEYLSFPSEVSQAAFEACLRDHPRLRAVELHACENVKDLSGLKALKELQALVLLPPSDQEGLTLDVLGDLKSLRLLVLEKDLLAKPPDRAARLRKDLPECLVEPGKGICLGSGWVLFLVAAGAAAGAVRAVRARRRSPAMPMR
jgi:hypothetical protein